MKAGAGPSALRIAEFKFLEDGAGVFCPAGSWFPTIGKWWIELDGIADPFDGAPCGLLGGVVHALAAQALGELPMEWCQNV